MRIQTSLTLLGLIALTFVAGCGRLGSKKSITPQPDAQTEKKNEEAVSIEYASPEKTLVDQAFQQAKSKGKLLMIDVTAAWCAPCQLASQGMKTGSEKFNEVMKKYDFLELEETFFVTHDFLPFPISAYPTFVVVDPATNKWSFTNSFGTIDELAEKLENFATKKSFLDEELNKFREDLAQNKKTEAAPLDWATLIIAEKSTQEIKALFAEIKKAYADKPDLFELDEDFAWQLYSFKQEIYEVLISRGSMTLEDVKTEDAEFFKAAANSATDIQFLAFKAPLSSLKLEKGTVAAALACDALAEKVGVDYVFTPVAIPDGATAEESKEITDSNKSEADTFEQAKTARKYSCLMRKTQAKLVKNDEVLAFVNSFTEEDLASGKAAVGYDALSNLLAVSGADFAKAVTFVEKETAASIENKEKSLKSGEEYIEKLKAEGQTEKAASFDSWFAGNRLCIPALKKSGEKRIAAYRAGLAHPALLSK